MSIDYAILAVLAGGPGTGYEVKSEFDAEEQGLIWGVSHGSIYTRLRELVKKGWIEEQEAEREGRGRKYYELTTQGWKALVDWQKSPSEYPLVKDDLLLKLAYWVDDDNRSALVEGLQVRKARSRRLLQLFEEIPTNNESSVGEYGFLVTQYVCMKLRAELDWLELAIHQLEGPPQSPVQDPHGIIPVRKERIREALECLRERGE